MLLPVMRPIGDVDEDAFAFDAGSFDSPLTNEVGEALPPAVSDVERQLLLAELVRVWTKSSEAGQTGTAQAVRLAAELARLIDQVQTARLTFDRIDQLVEGDLAAHWQATVKFLTIVTKHWPGILRARTVLIRRIGAIACWKHWRPNGAPHRPRVGSSPQGPRAASPLLPICLRSSPACRTARSCSPVSTGGWTNQAGKRSKKSIRNSV